MEIFPFILIILDILVTYSGSGHVMMSSYIDRFIFFFFYEHLIMYARFWHFFIIHYIYTVYR